MACPSWSSPRCDYSRRCNREYAERAQRYGKGESCSIFLFFMNFEHTTLLNIGPCPSRNRSIFSKLFRNGLCRPLNQSESCSGSRPIASPNRSRLIPCTRLYHASRSIVSTGQSNGTYPRNLMIFGLYCSSGSTPCSQFQMEDSVTPMISATSLWRRPRSIRRLRMCSPTVRGCSG